MLTDDQLIAELRDILIGYVLRYPAFRSKPIGAPRSLERQQHDMDIQREDRAKKVLFLKPGFEPNRGGEPK